VKERAISRYDGQWLAEARAAAKRGEHDLALRLYRYYIPVGFCSQDTRPAEIAAEHADLCYRTGRLGCYLQLRVRILSNRHARVSWSSVGHRVVPTEAEDLAQTGLDLHRFFLGLLVQFDAERPRREEIDPMRLATAIVDAGQADHMMHMLRRLAEDRSLDDWNRTRALMTASYVRLIETERRDTDKRHLRPQVVRRWNAAVRPLRGLRLPPAARAWLNRVR
jgi:hypothetical protein